MFITANPCADAERWEDERETKAMQAEEEKTAAYLEIREALTEGLQWGRDHTLPMPTGMAQRCTLEAIQEIYDSRDLSWLIDDALCTLGNLARTHPDAAASVARLADAYAQISIHEWERRK